MPIDWPAVLAFGLLGIIILLMGLYYYDTKAYARDKAHILEYLADGEYKRSIHIITFLEQKRTFVNYYGVHLYLDRMVDEGLLEKLKYTGPIAGRKSPSSPMYRLKQQ